MEFYTIELWLNVIKKQLMPLIVDIIINVACEHKEELQRPIQSLFHCECCNLWNTFILPLLHDTFWWFIAHQNNNVLLRTHIEIRHDRCKLKLLTSILNTGKKSHVKYLEFSEVPSFSTFFRHFHSIILLKFHNRITTEVPIFIFVLNFLSKIWKQCALSQISIPSGWKCIHLLFFLKFIFCCFRFYFKPQNRHKMVSL